MAKKKDLAFTELKVGLVIATALGILMVTTLYITREGGLPLIGGQYSVSSYLRDVNGLKAGSPVHLSGVEVGSVRRVEFAESGAPAPVKVSLTIRTDVQERIREDSLITVGSLGVLGEKMLEIEPGSADSPVVPDEGVVPGEAEGDPIKGIISDASRTMRDVRDLARDIQEGQGTLGAILKREDLHDQLLSFASRAEELLAAMDRSDGTLGKLIHDPQVYDNLNEMTLSMRELVARIDSGDGALGRLVRDKEIGDSIARSTANLARVTERIENGDGTLGALTSERELHDRIRSFSGNLDSITSRIDRGDGTMGQLLHDQKLYHNLNSAADEIQSLIKDIRADPKKYLRIKVSLF